MCNSGRNSGWLKNRGLLIMFADATPNQPNRLTQLACAAGYNECFARDNSFGLGICVSVRSSDESSPSPAGRNTPEIRAADTPSSLAIRPIASLETGPVQRIFRTFASSTTAAWFAAGLLIVAVFFVYRPCWHGDWLWDDGVLVLYNPLLKPGQLAKIWVPGSYLNFWPISYAAYWLEIRLFAYNPLGFHLVNIGLHAVAAILLWRMLVRLRLPGALLAAAIFALHPVNVETVAWISQLRGILSLDFALASLLLFLSYEQKLGRWRLALSLAAFVLSALSKGDVLTLPILLLALAWWQRGRITRQDLRRAAPYFLIAAVMAAVEVWTQHLLRSAAIRDDGLFSRAAIAGCAAWFYFWKFIWPLRLFPIYPRWTLPAPLLDYLPLAALWAGFAVAWRHRHGWGRPVVMLIVCYVALLLPVLGFVNITYMEHSLVADHWQYVAIIVPSAALAAACTLLARCWSPSGTVSILRGLRSKSGTIALALPLKAALLCGLAFLTRQQCTIYIDNIVFFGRTIANYPTSWIAEYNLGAVLQANGNPDAAIAHFQRAIALNPNCAKARNNLAKILLDRGRYAEAVPHLEIAIKSDPQMASPNCNLALAMEKLGNFDSAIAHLRRELEIDPDCKLARDQLDLAIAKRDRAAKALKEVEEQIRQAPKVPGLLDQAAWIMATSPFESLRNGPESVHMAELASKLTGGDDPFALATLAVAYAEAGRFDDATTAAERAHSLASSLPDDGKMAGKIAGWVAQFKNKKPFRDPQQE